jgi:hypothetical protein
MRLRPSPLGVALLMTLASAVSLGGCERGPSAEQRAALAATCEHDVDAWRARQDSLGAAYDARAYYDHAAERCVAHVTGGEAVGTRFESVVDVRRDRVIAGCSEVREAVGDTPCQVDGQPASGSAGRMTIDRLTGR